MDNISNNLETCRQIFKDNQWGDLLEASKRIEKDSKSILLVSSKEDSNEYFEGWLIEQVGGELEKTEFEIPKESVELYGRKIVFVFDWRRKITAKEVEFIESIKKASGFDYLIVFVGNRGDSSESEAIQFQKKVWGLFGEQRGTWEALRLEEFKCYEWSQEEGLPELLEHRIQTSIENLSVELNINSQNTDEQYIEILKSARLRLLDNSKETTQVDSGYEVLRKLRKSESKSLRELREIEISLSERVELSFDVLKKKVALCIDDCLEKGSENRKIEYRINSVVEKWEENQDEYIKGWLNNKLIELNAMLPDNELYDDINQTKIGSLRNLSVDEILSSLPKDTDVSFSDTDRRIKTVQTLPKSRLIAMGASSLGMLGIIRFLKFSIVPSILTGISAVASILYFGLRRQNQQISKDLRNLYVKQIESSRQEVKSKIESSIRTVEDSIRKYHQEIKNQYQEMETKSNDLMSENQIQQNAINQAILSLEN